MANPAQLLLVQLQEWHHPQNPASSHRSPQSDRWLRHRQAVKQLAAIEQLLNEMDGAKRKTAIYRRYLPSWYDAVFAYPSGWAGQGSAQIDQGMLEHLENLADVLDLFVATIEEDGLDQVRQYANLVTDALVRDTSVPAPLRMHAAEIVSHLMWCLDHYDIVGDFQLQEAMERLAATVLRVAANSSDENRSTVWGPVMTNWVWPFTVSMVAAIPSQALAMLALGSGG